MVDPSPEQKERVLKGYFPESFPYQDEERRSMIAHALSTLEKSSPAMARWLAANSESLLCMGGAQLYQKTTDLLAEAGARECASVKEAKERLKEWSACLETIPARHLNQVVRIITAEQDARIKTAEYDEDDNPEGDDDPSKTLANAVAYCITRLTKTNPATIPLVLDTLELYSNHASIAQTIANHTPHVLKTGGTRAYELLKRAYRIDDPSFGQKIATTTARIIRSHGEETYWTIMDSLFDLHPYNPYLVDELIPEKLPVGDLAWYLHQLETIKSVAPHNRNMTDVLFQGNVILNLFGCHCYEELVKTGKAMHPETDKLFDSFPGFPAVPIGMLNCQGTNYTCCALQAIDKAYMKDAQLGQEVMDFIIEDYTNKTRKDARLRKCSSPDPFLLELIHDQRSAGLVSQAIDMKNHKKEYAEKTGGFF